MPSVLGLDRLPTKTFSLHRSSSREHRDFTKALRSIQLRVLPLRYQFVRHMLLSTIWLPTSLNNPNMVTRKRNEFLDAGESEDDEREYDLEEDSRARLLKGPKRQKVAYDSDLEEADSVSADVYDAESPTYGVVNAGDPEDRSDDEDTAHFQSLVASNSSNTRLKQPLMLPTKPKKDKSGIIYLSRCPPFMKPSVLRSLLTPYGPVGRIFLTPEPSSSRTQRLKAGGTKRKLFLDGWVEFTHKKDAKFVAEQLNSNIIGGKKRSRYYDEVWNIKYLSGVKWSHLVEQIQNENAERQVRMRAEIAQSKKENQRFLEDLERGKIGKTMEARKKERGKPEDGSRVSGTLEADRGNEKGKKRDFRQNEVKTKAQKKLEPGQDVNRVLKAMF
jgi:ESF2/ABP1 family protein